jgi:hypothetical protein
MTDHELTLVIDGDLANETIARALFEDEGVPHGLDVTPPHLC